MSAISPLVRRIGLAAHESTYVYDLDRLRARCELLKNLPIAHKRVFFATMANDHPDILSCVRDCGMGVFVNSPLHLKLVLDLEFQPSQVVYAASSMDAEQMRRCVEHGVNLVLDSLGQVLTLTKVARGVDIGLRLNVGSALDRTELRSDPTYRFGVTADEIAPTLDAAAAADIRIIGAHSYFGTGIMQPDLLLKGLQRLAQSAVGSLPDLQYLDAGGGFGVPDVHGGAEFDLQRYGIDAAQIMRCCEGYLGRSLELYLEPGRYLAADCGFYFVKVIDFKIRRDRVFIGTNGSVADFPRPLLYPDTARHPCELIGADTDNMPFRLPAFVCGNTTYSQDFLCRHVALPLPRAGDTIVLHNAGAYGRSMATRFLGRRTASEVVVAASCTHTLAGPAK